MVSVEEFSGGRRIERFGEDLIVSVVMGIYCTKHDTIVNRKSSTSKCYRTQYRRVLSTTVDTVTLPRRDSLVQGVFSLTHHHHQMISKSHEILSDKGNVELLFSCFETLAVTLNNQ